MLAKKRSIPWLTSLITLLCIGMFVSFTYFKSLNLTDLEIYNKLGAPAALRIYQGQYWGVFWNSFLHNRITLLLPNIAIVFILGTFIERKSSFLNIFALGLLASATTSIVQLSLTENPGIGMTGINFFLLSYIIGRGFVNDEFKMKFRFHLLIVALAVLIYSIIMNSYYNSNIGEISMIAGLLFGFTTGVLAMPKRKYVSKIFGACLLLSLSTTLFYAPWTVEWNLHKALEAYEKDDIKQTKFHYNEMLRISPENKNASQNLRSIRIDELCANALIVHENGDYLKARVLYDEILDLDPNNDWVKEQIRILP